MRASEARSALRVPLIIATVVVAALVGYLVTVAARGSDDKTAGPIARLILPRPLAEATASPSPEPSPPTAPLPTAAGVRRALAGPAGASALGGRLLARVADATTGTVLYNRGGSTPAPPASTAKLLVAAAAFDVYSPTHRFATTVVAGSAPGTVVLVGGGDPTLTGAPKDEPGAYGSGARITALAAQLRGARVRVTRIVLDTSRFTGPTVSPFWDPADSPSDYASPITALMIDGGRDQPGDVIRSASPAAAAGRALARALGKPSLPVGSGRAPARAKRLARVFSAPLSTLVRQMLHQSDNVIAEVLARQVAIATHHPPSFVGGAAAVRGVLARLGTQIGGGMHDASGLAAADRLSPAEVVAVLRLIAGPKVPALRGIVGALPVAGWSGTLIDRYVSGSSASAAGLIRAKTGTLTGVSALAGYVHDRSGRLLVFAFDADRTGDTETAEAALDRTVSVLARCGCR